MPYSQSLVIDGRTYTRGNVPDGWRMIEPGEPIQPGDRVYWSHGIRYGYGLCLAQGPEMCPDAYEIWAAGQPGYLLGPGDYGRVIRRINVQHHDARSNARIRITSIDAHSTTAEIRRGRRVISVTKTLAARQGRDALVTQVKKMREARAILAKLPRNSELFSVRECLRDLKALIRHARSELREGLSIRAERGRRTEILLQSNVRQWTVTISTGLPRLLSYGPVSSYLQLGTGRSRTRLSELKDYGSYSGEEQVAYCARSLKDAYQGAMACLRTFRRQLRTPDTLEVERTLPRSGVRLMVPSMHYRYDRRTGQSARSGWVLRQLKTLDKTAILNGDAPRPQVGERYVGIEIECYVRPEACSRPCHCLDDDGAPYRYCESCNGDGIQYHTQGSSFEPIADVLVRHGVKRGEVSLTSDGSLGSHHLGIPVEVRVLASESRLDEVLTRVCGALAEMHARVDASCGGHVHIDCRASTGRDGAEVYRRMVCALPLLANMVEESRVNGDSEYCQLNRDPDEFNDGDRYYAINAESLSAHGTIEVRLSHGMLEKGEILMWCRTLIQIADHGGDLTSRVRKLSTFFQRLKIDENPMLRHFILHRVYQYGYANHHCGSRFTLNMDIADPALSERPAEVIAA